MQGGLRKRGKSKANFSASTFLSSLSKFKSVLGGTMNGISSIEDHPGGFFLLRELAVLEGTKRDIDRNVDSWGHSRNKEKKAEQMSSVPRGKEYWERKWTKKKRAKKEGPFKEQPR